MYFPKLEDWGDEWDWSNPSVAQDFPECSECRCVVRVAHGGDDQYWVWHGEGEAIRPLPHTSTEADGKWATWTAGLQKFFQECHEYEDQVKEEVA